MSTQKKRIPDPTIRTGLPTSLLSAVTATEESLRSATLRAARLRDLLGSGRRTADIYDLEGEELTNVIDFARENARLAWVLTGILDDISDSLVGATLIPPDQPEVIAALRDLLEPADAAAAMEAIRAPLDPDKPAGRCCGGSCC